MDSSLQVDHKEETDGKCNLGCAMKGLFITHGSRGTAGGLPKGENAEELESWLCTAIVKSSVRFRKTPAFFCVSCEGVTHPTGNQELLCFLMKGNSIYGRFLYLVKAAQQFVIN